MHKFKVGDIVKFSDNYLCKTGLKSKFRIGNYDSDVSVFTKHGSTIINYEHYTKYGVRIVGIKDDNNYYVEYIDEFGRFVCLIFNIKCLKLIKKKDFEDYKKENDYI